MNPLTKSLIKCAGALAAAIPLAAASLPARAQDIISNTAQAEWDSGVQRLSRPSNTVDITVDRSTPPPPATLQLFHFTSGPSGQPTNLPATMCMGSSGPRPVDLSGAFSQYSANPAAITPTAAIRAGEPLILKVTSALQNASATAIDSFTATITTQNGDRESITMTETAVNSGIFLAVINTAATPASPVIGDCVLTVRPGDTLTFDLGNGVGGGTIATGTVDILVDPFGLTFDSGDGAPVSGTRVTIVDAATGVPAQVFGDDGVSTFPNSLITGSTVTDSSGASYPFDAGFYRFPFLRPGVYRLVITPPAPYTAPSAATPAEIALLTRPDGGPFIIAPGSYGGTITLSDPAPVRIDVPMDRPGSQLQLTKTTSSVTAMPGDIVQYRVEVRNPDSTRASGPVTVTDILPNAMRLRLNSVRYNGGLVTPTVAADGARFSVIVAPLAGGQSGLLTYLAEVRTDARPGNAINLASARDNRGAVSDNADSTIRIVRDGISERFTIIGRITDGGCDVHDEDQRHRVAGT